MPELKLTDEQKMLRDMVRDFVNREIKPIARQIDEEEEIPRELIRKLADLGLLGAAFPPEYGGGGFGEVGYCLMQEEIERGCVSTATFIGAHQSIGSNAIYLGGNETLKNNYLPRMATGELIGAYCVTEPNAGTDVAALSTVAVDKGDHYARSGSAERPGSGRGMYLLLDVDVPFVADPTRGPASRRGELHERFLRALGEAGVAHELVSGSWEERLRQALRHAARLPVFEPLHDGPEHR